MDSPSLIRQIPLEVFLQVSSYLSTPDLCSLRRTCKHAEVSLFETFAKEFFSKRQFMLSETSLQALIDISNHQRLSQYLNHVIIGLDSFETGILPPGFSQTAGANRYNAGLADERTLLSTGRDREMLAEAFRNLPNLQTVGLRDYSSYRVRDKSLWNSYGATTIAKETGVRFLDLRSRYGTDVGAHFGGRAFSSILYALGQSGAKLQAFEVYLTNPTSGLYYDAFKIPKFFEPLVLPDLSSLKTLILTIDPKLPESDNGTEDDPDVEYPDLPLRQFLCHTPNLTNLRINFNSQLRSNPRRFMAWLGRPVVPGPLLSRSPEPIALSHLQKLDVGMLIISPRVLLAVINKFKATLRSLSLWKVHLDPEDQHRQAGKRVSAWPKFLSHLPDLDYLSVGCIGQVLPTRHQNMAFKLPAGRSGEPEFVRTCSRPGDMADFLNNLISDAVVTWPEGNSLSDDESMSDDEYDSDSDIDMDDDE